ncbi:hypothetical protein HOY34_11165 [Xinfangfangia sp. D13-10-4-6]|uniref:hypothetical protein n=1 Tax=Pseudogemmobacter hezensis TaxID=2737662 RepID=UPI0015579F28|nr:hypothetical protein [Pseudogemmobacter hezensis]NPD15762.1 hypothetical protein [Pseudogemmobacter hezensis]
MPDIIPHLIWGYICVGAFSCGIAHGMADRVSFGLHFALFFAWPVIWVLGAIQKAKRGRK